MDKCPKCGYVENIPSTVAIHNFMNEYIDSETGKVDCVLNSQEKEVSVPANKKTGQPAKKLIRKDLFTDKAKTVNVPTPKPSEPVKPA